MKSWKIARFAGIDVSVHWTFALLLGWVAFSSLAGGVASVLFNLAVVIAVFTCVVLHEYGHALAARQFGIGTRGITLLPIGGVASLEAIPRNPLQELWIAIAGPLVNVAIAVILFVLYPGVLLSTSAAPAMVSYLFYINIVLVCFNLVPAFPMDGGRVLRSLLALAMPYVDATRIANAVGKVMAALLAVVGLFYNPMLLLVAGFVVLAGNAETRMVEAQYGRSPLNTATPWGQRPPWAEAVEPSSRSRVKPIQGVIVFDDDRGFGHYDPRSTDGNSSAFVRG